MKTVARERERDKQTHHFIYRLLFLSNNISEFIIFYLLTVNRCKTKTILTLIYIFVSWTDY